MKRIVFLFALFCALTAGIAAQQIKASPFEGRWVWDGKGEDDPEFSELIFFGNIMLGKFSEELPIFTGSSFTQTNRKITFADGDYEWEYRLSGNILNITDDYDDRYNYTKAAMVKSPLEGIWKVTGGEDYDPDADYFLVFAGEIMAVGDEDEYIGYEVEFSGKTFFPTRDSFGEKRSGKPTAEESVEYRLSGRTLTIIDSDGDELRLTKVY